jgi:hypothetical protein
MEIHEERKQSYTMSERKQLLFKTPSEKSQSITHMYEAGQDTHEKVKMFLDKRSDND